MSLALYNPMEAAILLWCVYLFRKKEVQNEKFDLKKFIANCYILGTIFFIIQSPTNIENWDRTVDYTNLINFIVLPAVLCFYCRKYGTIRNIAIMYCYVFSVIFIMEVTNAPSIIGLISENFNSEFCTNLFIKAIQLCIVLFIIIGRYILKKLLIASAKKNIKNMVAPTVCGYGEPKLSKKLQDEIK